MALQPALLPVLRYLVPSISRWLTCCWCVHQQLSEQSKAYKHVQRTESHITTAVQRAGSLSCNTKVREKER